MLRRLFARLRNSLHQDNAERDLAHEVASHLALIEEDFLRRGMTPDEARAAARRAFGGVEQAKEVQRDARSFRWLDDAGRDLGYAIRTLRRTPGFAAAAIVTIGLGLGANMAIFSLVNAVMLKTLPVRAPGELVFLNVMRAGGRIGNAPPYPCYEIVRDKSRSFSGMAAYTGDSMMVVIDGRAEKVLGQLASGTFHELLGVRPALGRVLTPADDRDPSVAVLGYQYWQRRFGGDPNIIGRTIVYQNSPLTVVGVSAAGFSGVEPGFSIDITVPFTIVGPAALAERTRWWFSAVARLKPGVSRTQAAAEIDPMFQAFMSDSSVPESERKHFVNLTLTSALHGGRSLREQFSQPLVLLTGISAIVLLIACANVANLLLARSAARRHEFATRVAIGASRGRLIRQVMTESLLLGAAGTALGILLARWLVTAVTGPLATGPFAPSFDLEPDYRVVIFALLLCLTTSVVFGLAPAVRAGRVELVTDLKGATVTNLRRAWRKWIPSSGSSLVIAQIALSLVLMVTMSLLLGTLAALRSVETGFRARNVAILNVELVDTGAPREALPPKWMAILDRIHTLPGVESASLSWLTPLSMRHRGVAIQVVGQDPGLTRPAGIALNHISPDYFDTMGIAVKRGRTFTARDDGRAPRVAMLNETAVRHFFGDRDPLGQRVMLFKLEHEIIGVVADSKHLSLRDEVPPFMFLPILQPVDRLGGLTLAVRPSPASTGVVEAVGQELARSGSGVVAGRAVSLRQQVDRSLLNERLMSMISSGFGGIGLALSAIGLFGVMSFGVVRRMREIAVRMALGASASAVRRQVLRESLTLTATGLLIGVPLSLVAAQTLTTVLFGLDPYDPRMLALSSGLVIVVAALAGYLPARRASRIDPMAVLRAE